MVKRAHRPQYHHWLAYFYGLREGRTLKRSHVRDGGAFARISVPLAERGYAYGHLVPNGPPAWEEIQAKMKIVQDAQVRQEGSRHVEDLVDYNPIDMSFLKPGDKLIVPTRPPMNDMVHGDKVHNQPGFTSLEQIVFRRVRQWVRVCSRSHVKLQVELAASLLQGHENRGDTTYFLTGEPSYRMLQVADGSVKGKWMDRSLRMTAAYLLHLPRVEDLNGADLLVFWGMGGEQTLAFANRLNADLSYLIDLWGFSMVEFTPPEGLATNSTLDFGLDWDAKVLLEGAWPTAIPASRALRGNGKTPGEGERVGMRTARPASRGKRERGA